MNKLISFLVLSATAMPTMANGNFVPEPSVLPLLGVGALALAFMKYLKK